MSTAGGIVSYMKSCLMLACHNIKDELLTAVEESEAVFPIFFIPRRLHLFPDKLRVYLQEMIDSIENVDYILLPMGMCGNGTIGLVSKAASIVLPKCGDCIDLILSENDLKAKRPTYSYFLTSGWLGDDGSLDTELKRTIEKYGLEQAAMVMDMMYKNYKDFCIIDTGTYNIEDAKEKIMPLVEITKLEITVAKGHYGVLRKMAALDFDDNFVIIPPGETVSTKHFGI